jgi:hypothetical protein
MVDQKIVTSANKALHLTAIPLGSIAAGELGRYTSIIKTINKDEYSPF